MKKSLSLITIVGALALASCTRTPEKSTRTDRESTQRIGQSGSNGTGDGVKQNMLNGTGDGFPNQQGKTYSQQLQEKGLLATHAAGHAEHQPAAHTTHEQTAPSEAHADAKNPEH